eukprot:15104-Alexandrium_andersonii.AAC.1
MRGSEVAKSPTRRLQSAIRPSAIRAILCYWRARSQTIARGASTPSLGSAGCLTRRELGESL